MKHIGLLNTVGSVNGTVSQTKESSAGFQNSSGYALNIRKVSQRRAAKQTDDYHNFEVDMLDMTHNTDFKSIEARKNEPMDHQV